MTSGSQSYSLPVAQHLKQHGKFDSFTARRRQLASWGVESSAAYAQAAQEHGAGHLIPEERRNPNPDRLPDGAIDDVYELSREDAVSLLERAETAATTDEQLAACRRLQVHILAHDKDDWTQHIFGPQSYVEFVASEGSDGDTADELRACHAMNEKARQQLLIGQYETPPIVVTSDDRQLFDTMLAASF